jgi:hypothetical protein
VRIRHILLCAASVAAVSLPITLAVSGGSASQAAVGPSGQLVAAVSSDQTRTVSSAQRKAATARAARAHRKALKRVTRLARTRARLAGKRHRGKRYLRAVSTWSTPRLKRHAKRLNRRVRHLRLTGGAPNVSIPPALHAIARCESGGNPRAVSAGGTYRGLFQFDYRTWASVGGKGDPAAASRTEQYRRAAMLYARAGASPWPVCGR